MTHDDRLVAVLSRALLLLTLIGAKSLTFLSDQVLSRYTNNIAEAQFCDELCRFVLFVNVVFCCRMSAQPEHFAMLIAYRCAMLQNSHWAGKHS